jgi:hypothetical protein
MNLKKLQIFLHLPREACDYSAELKQDVMGNIPPPPIDRASSKKAAIGIIETISKAQERSLEWLTLHFTREGYYDRFQPYLMWGNMQVRRSKDNNADGDNAYEVRGRQTWDSRAATLHDELIFEEE